MILAGLEYLTWLWLLIFLHECGHFLIAYLLDRPIGRMEIGAGPVLGQHEWKGIVICIKLVPISGYVTLIFQSRKKWKNLLIYSGGAIANLLGALVLYFMSLSEIAALSFWLGIFNLYPMKGLDGSLIVNELKRVRSQEL